MTDSTQKSRSTPALSLSHAASRLFLALLFCLLLGPSVRAQQASSQLPLDPAYGIVTLPLWTNPTGSADQVKAMEQSTLTVFPPQSGKANGTSVIIAPGGAYLRLVSNLEGRQVADWFAARGVTAFVLKYRLGPDNPYPAPLLDAQRAVRVVRSLSTQYKLSPDRIGFVGFSAGGHLAAMTGTSFSNSSQADDPNPATGDPIDRLSDRPDFLVLGYPWLNAMQPNTQNLITYCSVMPSLPADKCRAWQTEYTPALHVSANTPSTFIFGTSDDQTVPASGIIDFYRAMIDAHAPVELHMFRHGGHGSGLGSGDEALDTWPSLLEIWMRSQGWLTPQPR